MRFGGIALIAGSVALLVLVVVLWRMTRVPADPNAARMPAATAPTEPRDSTLASPATATPATAHGRSATVQMPPAAPATSGTAAPPPPAGDSPALPATGEGEKKRVPLATKAVLREAVATLDGAVGECVRRYGHGVSGTANLNFTLAPIKGKAVIESTGVIEEGTTVTNNDLLECMHKTALPLQFPFVADATAVYARRVVRIDNGKMVDQHLVNFSYIP